MFWQRVPVGVPPDGLIVLKIRVTSSSFFIFLYPPAGAPALVSAGDEDLWFRKYMSIPSASWAVQIGVMVRRARDTSRHERPAMLPESSIRKIVSNWLRNA